MLGTACNVSRAGFLLLVLVGKDHLAFQSFSGHFSHFTSDNFGLKATLYVIIGEFFRSGFRNGNNQNFFSRHFQDSKYVCEKNVFFGSLWSDFPTKLDLCGLHRIVER